MKIGKVPETVLKRSILKQIRHRRSEVLVRPGVGEDCSVIGVQPEEVISISTDPITGASSELGTLAVYTTANDIAVSGAEMIGIMLSVLLPDQARESDLRDMMKEIEVACSELNVEVLGGHTEVTPAVNQPIITVTGIGKMLKSDIITTSGVKPGQEIIMTKWAGLEGTAIIAKERENSLLERYSADFIDQGKSFLKYISIVKEAAIAKKWGATSMHDVTEGGIFGALWEMGAASNVGLEIDLKKIPVKQETIEICEYFDLNPYLLISGGSMLLSTDRGNELLESLKAEGIPATIIGKAVKGRERVVINEEEKRYLEPPKSDELYKVFYS